MCNLEITIVLLYYESINNNSTTTINTNTLLSLYK